MSAQPSAGHGRLSSGTQMPDKSGLPSAVRGAGASRFGSPAAVFGTHAVGYFTHCAPTGKAVATSSAITMTHARELLNLVIWSSGHRVIDGRIDLILAPMRACSAALVVHMWRGPFRAAKTYNSGVRKW